MAKEYSLIIPRVDSNITPNKMTDQLLDYLKGEELVDVSTTEPQIFTTMINDLYLISSGGIGVSESHVFLATTKKAGKRLKKIEEGLRELVTINTDWFDNMKDIVEGRE